MEKIIIKKISVSYEDDGKEKNETFDESSTNLDKISEEISKSLTTEVAAVCRKLSLTTKKVKAD